MIPNICKPSFVCTTTTKMLMLFPESTVTLPVTRCVVPLTKNAFMRFSDIKTGKNNLAKKLKCSHM
jgi:hypothetical protein